MIREDQETGFRERQDPLFLHIPDTSREIPSMEIPISFPANTLQAGMKNGKDEKKTLFLYTDGASRGNPGPSAWAYLILDEKGATLEERAGGIGIRTNNEAEYHGLIEGLRAALRHGGTKISVCSDSELVIRQMNGRYRVSAPRLLPLFHEAKSVAGKFRTIEYHSVPREHPVITRADRLCNAVLDEEARR